MMYHGLRCSERITECVSEGKTVGRKASLGTKHGECEREGEREKKQIVHRGAGVTGAHFCRMQ